MIIPSIRKGKWRISVPASKSLTNRAIHLASLAKGSSCLHNILWSDDTKYMTQAWSHLGAKISRKKETMCITGCEGKLKKYEDFIYTGNAGTVARFLSSAFFLGQGSYLLTGDDDMKKRPIAHLTDVLEYLGCKISFFDKEGCLPLEIQKKHSHKIANLAEIYIDCNVSSQYLSSLLMILPLCDFDTVLKLKNTLVSKPYIDMTLSIMAQFGVLINQDKIDNYYIKGQQEYKSCNYFIENDYSSLSYFLALTAITSSEIIVPKLTKKSLQGDMVFISILEKMGCHFKWKDDVLYFYGAQVLKGIHINMMDMTDIVPSLCAVALFAQSTSIISGVDHMKYKECDRIKVLVQELSKIGCHISYKDKKIIIIPSKTYKAHCYNTHNDHRMAMTFAIIASQIKGSRILNAKCVEKTFPNFFEQLNLCV